MARVLPRCRLAITGGLVLAGVSAMGCRGSEAPGPGGSSTRVQVFEGARIFDGRSPGLLAQGVLLVRGGRIESVGESAAVRIPDGAERIDLSGRTIVPGLINTHGHVGETRGLASGPEHYSRENVLDHLRQYARHGVTTVFSLGGDQAAGAAVRDEQERVVLDRARLFIAGPVITARTPDEARAQVDAAAALKPEFIKIRVDDNLGTTEKMAPDVYGAVIERAHALGLPVAVHVYYLDDAKAVLKAGADYIAHSVRDEDVDDELVGLLKSREVCYCPTLTREVSTFVYESEPAFFSDAFFLRYADADVVRQLQDPARQQAIRDSRAAQSYKASLGRASRNLKTLADRGVRIAFGTDTGPPARFLGYFEHMEAEMMAEAGLSPAQVLRAATVDAAECMRVQGRLGTLEAGAWADFLVLEQSPLADIRNLRSLREVWMAGHRVASW